MTDFFVLKFFSQTHHEQRMTLTADSLFDLSTMMLDYTQPVVDQNGIGTLFRFPSSIVNLHANERVSQLFSTLHFFGFARNCDSSFNEQAVALLYRQFARDICILQTYINQLSAHFRFLPRTDGFFCRLDTVSTLVSSVQQILNRININNVKPYASWRFVLYRSMLQCCSMINAGIHRNRLSLYSQLMSDCGGLDFLPELQVFCEILRKITLNYRLVGIKAFLCQDLFNQLADMLQKKIQMAQPAQKRKSSFLSQSWSSTSGSDDEVEEEENCVQEDAVEVIYLNADPIDTLLSLSPQSLDAEKTFLDGFHVDFDTKNKVDVKLSIISQDDEIVCTNQKKVVSEMPSVEKWRSPSLEAAKERYLEQQEEKKRKQRFPYRRHRKLSSATAAINGVENLLAKAEENNVANHQSATAISTPLTSKTSPRTPSKSSVNNVEEKKTTSPKNRGAAASQASPPPTPPQQPLSPPNLPRQASSPPTPPRQDSSDAGASQKTPEKKKKRNYYNRIWLKK